MNTRDTDILNVILIVISLMVAFQVPFGLLIFSYVFLGPIHYLTEINWLKEKKYFVKETKWIWILLAFVAFVSIPVFLKLPLFAGTNVSPQITKWSNFILGYTDEVLVTAILFAIGLIYLRNKVHIILILMGSALLATLFLNYFPDFALLVTIFLPTIVHVYLFTLLFMIFGTINSKSTPGIIAIILLALAPVIIMLSKINPADYFVIKDYTRNSFNDSGFGNLNVLVAKYFTPEGSGQFNYFSAVGIKIQIFVAFAYTYHYLNWFSKTSIIRWDKSLSKTKIIAIFSIWAISVALYLYDFKIGLIVLSFLSLAHVLLEFPLNMTSIKGICLKIKSQFIS